MTNLAKQLEPIDFKLLSQHDKISSLTKATEIVLVIMARHLNVTPFQVAFFLAEKKTLWVKLVSAGVRGDFKAVIRIFEDFYKQVDHILVFALLDQTKDTFLLFLDVLKTGFVSKEIQVVKWTINTLSKLVYSLAHKDYTNEIYEFLVRKAKLIPVGKKY